MAEKDSDVPFEIQVHTGSVRVPSSSELVEAAVSFNG